MPRLPADLAPGAEVEVGKARVAWSPEGLLEACDPHGCSRLKVPSGVAVRLIPTPAVQRLLRVDYIYVEFENPVYVEEGDKVWFYAPIELNVSVSSLEAARLSPVDVKFTLVGDIVDGVICRYYKSPAGLNEAPGSPPEGSAVAVALVARGSGILRGMGVGASFSRLYMDGEGVLYYSLQRLEIEGGVASLRPTTEPPRRGLRELSRPPRRRALLHQVLQPLTFEVGG